VKQMEPNNTGACHEKRRQLGEQYAISARLYTEAVVRLTQNSGTMPYEEYARLYEAAEKARRDSEAARIAFEGHADSHRHCGAQCCLTISTGQ
jgi:hypothetical protein